MKYHAATKKLVIDLEALENIAFLCRHAIRNIREIKRLNPAGYDWSKPMEAAQFAEKDVLDIAAALEIDLGTPVNGRLSFGDLDVREA